MSGSARKTRVFVAIAVVCATTLGLAFWYFDRCSADADTCAAVESAFTRAVIVDSVKNVAGAFTESAEAIRSNHGPDAVSAALLVTQTRTGNPTRSQVVQHLQDARTTLTHTFTGPALSKQLATLDSVWSTLDPQSGEVDAGIGKVKVKDVKVTGNTATEKAEVEVWGRQQPYQDVDGNWRSAEPHNEINAVMTLTRDDAGNWLVDTFTWDFVPGQGP